MNKTLITWVIIFSLILLIGSYFIFSSPSKKTNLISYSRQDSQKPTAYVKESFKDFGKIKVADKQEVTFTLKNTGKKTLQLSGISSSCGCTAAQIIYKGKPSKEYSMHFQEEDVYEIDPQTEAKIKIIYRPFSMPVYGLVEREAYITTNDPQNEKLVFKIKAFVE